VKSKTKTVRIIERKMCIKLRKAITIDVWVLR